jgi:hypothetical protein
MSGVIEMPNRADCQHEWKEEYYGWQCVHCKLFYAFGCAPWDDEDPWSDEDDYIAACGEFS